MVRALVLKDGYLFIGMGEKTDLKDSAQTLNNHLGKSTSHL